MSGRLYWEGEDPHWHVCGIPSVFYTDHGSDFTSRHMEQVAADLGIELIFSEKGVPRGRGKIERFFRSINELFLQDLPGYASSGYKGVEATLTLPAFEQQFRSWLLRPTQRRESAELCHTHQLLMTKLAVPAAQPWLLSRSRLLAQLAQDRSRLTLLCAPAGFGKSALLSDWLHTSHQDSHASGITWLILEEADNNPLRWHTFDQALQVAHVNSNQSLVLTIRCNQAKLLAAQGQLRQAAATYQQVLQASIESRGRGLPEEASAYLGLGEIHREWNALTPALETLTRGLELANLIGEMGTLYTGYMILARVKYAQGETDQAFEVLQQAEQRLHTPLYTAQLVAYRVRLWLAQQEVTRAAAWGRACGLTTEDQPSYQREWEYLTLVRLRCVQHRADETMPLLRRLLGMAEKGKRTGSMIEILMLQALVHQALGQTQQALFQLTQALQLAEAHGYTRLFLDERPSLVALLHQAAARQIVPGYVRALLAQFPDTVARLSVQGGTGLQLLLEPLSERERTVLRLVAAGLSNQECAAQLSITAGAVKKHLSNIYSKLGVNSRTQALARARELDLL